MVDAKAVDISDLTLSASVASSSSSSSSSVASSSSSSSSSPFTIQGGPPEIQPNEIQYFEKIGGGCFGEVYRGKCRGIEVAVKKLNRQALDDKTMADFKKEVEIMSKLNHPNVVLFMGACTTEGHMAIVSELMPKGNLEELLTNTKLQLSLYQRLQMGRGAALGMNWLHESKPQILHRDLKPQNLLIDANINVKVCDFGLSVVKQRGEVLRDKDSIPGTPLWMAPEVLQGKEVDEKSDVYSFGLILWEILTCQEPFSHHEDYVTFKRAICYKGERPPIPEDCLPSLKHLMKSCWQKDPAKRPSFLQIIPMLDIVIVDCGINDEGGRKLWKKKFLGKEEVMWDRFVPALMKLLEIPVPDHDDIKLKCLKAILSEKSRDPTLSGQPIVTLEKFGRICDLFGPLSNEGKKTSFLDRILEVMRNEWFHGEISKEDAEARLTGQSNGTFLVRFSSTSVCFTVTKVSRKGKINHQRLRFSHEEGFSVTIRTEKGSRTLRGSANGSLEHFIRKYSSELYLKKPCSGSPFRSLFLKTPSLDGYLLCDDDEEESD